ncbi:MAG: mandelate racemase/muconate lactonizing enzyme family protein [Planctomycetes bacterium]|nr:mandelate racemase/muconate lactonizing enzyme family protein [Planctomycetota bacterium]
MRIDAIDVYYLRMPQVLDIGDGSQDATLVRVRAGAHLGWGQCEASPLASIAALVCPLSHSACKPVQDSVLGERVESPEDIIAIGDRVRANSLDLLQADHMLSGIDIALWDLLGRARECPVWRLLGYAQAYAKMPYASVLFGDTPQETLTKAKAARAQRFRAAKFGWGPFGRGLAGADRDQLMAAREGLGPDGLLLVDAGTVWAEDVAKAAERAQALKDSRATWLEEPFHTGALAEYASLAAIAAPVRLAGGEGSHNFHMARHLIDHAKVGFIQIDTGRIGGISPAKRVADYASARGVTYVNHTFTSHLSLSASLQPYAGIARDEICEYPVEAKPLSCDLTRERIERDAAGLVHLPDAPGLGMTPDPATIARYLVDVSIVVAGREIYRSPAVSG